MQNVPHKLLAGHYEPSLTMLVETFCCQHSTLDHMCWWTLATVVNAELGRCCVILFRDITCSCSTMYWWDIDAYFLALCFVCKELRSVHLIAGRRPANAACKWLGMFSAMAGVQQSSMLSRIAKQWVRFTAGRRPANLNISIAPDTWSDLDCATRRYLRSAGRVLNGVSAMLSEAF